MKNRYELRLALGLAALTLAMAVVPFSIFGLLALPLVVVALPLLVLGTAGARGTREQGVSLWRQAVGLLLLVLGVAALLFVAFVTSMLASQAAMHWERPSQPTPAMGEWLFMAKIWVLPAAFSALGLWCWTGWAFHRCLKWAIAVSFVCPGSLLIFVMLHGFGMMVTN